MGLKQVLQVQIRISWGKCSPFFPIECIGKDERDDVGSFSHTALSVLTASYAIICLILVLIQF